MASRRFAGSFEVPHDARMVFIELARRRVVALLSLIAVYAEIAGCGGRAARGGRRDSTGAELIASGRLEGEEDLREARGDYTANEQVLAAYGMVEIGLSDRVTFLGGVRYEGTEVDGIGHELHFNEDGDHSGTFPTRTSGSYDDFLPQLHLVYAIDDNTNLRFAATQGIARPRYFDIVPHQRTNFEDDRIDRGNSDLKRTIGTSFDVLFERYFPGSIGVISAGVFYKDLDDPIVSLTSQEVIDGELWDVPQPVNGESAKIVGWEFAYQNQLRRLPEPWNGLGVLFNYTWADSEAVVEGLAEKVEFPQQPKNTYNAAVSYEKGRFSTRLSYQFIDKHLSGLGDGPGDTDACTTSTSSGTSWRTSMSAAPSACTSTWSTRTIAPSTSSSRVVSAARRRSSSAARTTVGGERLG